MRTVKDVQLPFNKNHKRHKHKIWDLSQMWHHPYQYSNAQIIAFILYSQLFLKHSLPYCSGLLLIATITDVEAVLCVDLCVCS